jgi:hypothetical protein
MKRCLECGEKFPENAFPLACAHGRTYRRNQCRMCYLEYFKKRYRQTPKSKRILAMMNGGNREV